LRFRWIQEPGNDTFFIWTQNWLETPSQLVNVGPVTPARGYRVLDRRGAAKIVRTFRF
jgi:hypothetical protein